MSELNEAQKNEIPFVLILKRKTIRTYPDGTRVALYSNDRLGTTFAIPFNDDSTNGTIVRPVTEELEEELLNEDASSVLKKIRAVAKSGHKGTIELQSGQTHIVDAYSAESILKVYGKLDAGKKEKYVRHLAVDKASFIRGLDFALQHLDKVPK